MFRQRNPRLLLSSLVAVYMQGQLLKNCHKEKKVIIEVYGEEKQMLELKADPNNNKYWAPRQMPFQVAWRDIKIFYPLFMYKALHSKSVCLNITVCKLSTTCV